MFSGSCRGVFGELSGSCRGVFGEFSVQLSFVEMKGDHVQKSGNHLQTFFGNAGTMCKMSEATQITIWELLGAASNWLLMAQHIRYHII